MLKSIRNAWRRATGQVPKTTPDIRTAAGRVYFEYFTSPAPDGAGYRWLARVYAPGGVVTEKAGAERTEPRAKKAAVKWAEQTKVSLAAEV